MRAPSALLFVALLSLTLDMRAATDPVKVEGGLVTGAIDRGVRVFKGIPYAAPPVGGLRWKPPQPVISWSGVRDGSALGAECPQTQYPSTSIYVRPLQPQSEDCLFVNVWTTATATARQPVLVWIHGGALTRGSGISDTRDGVPLARKGVVLVSLNYRLGPLGYLAHPELSAESPHSSSGNYGVLDQIAALQWVQQNIAAFGGDPANVTLIGQSAGSMSINNLQASPLAKGLFKRIIGMSGATFRSGVAAQTTLADAEAQGVKLQEALKVTSLAGMRGFSSDKVVTAAQTGGVRGGQIVDGYFLPDTVDNIFSKGAQSDAAVLTGSTAKDIGTTVPIRAARTLDEYKALATQMYGERAADLLALYPATSDAEATRQAEEIGRNSGFSVAARTWAREQARSGKEPS